MKWVILISYKVRNVKRGKIQEYILWGIFNFDTKTWKDWYKKIILGTWYKNFK